VSLVALRLQLSNVALVHTEDLTHTPVHTEDLTQTLTSSAIAIAE
jgi:hypothetical protein